MENVEYSKELKHFVNDSLWMYKTFRRTVESTLHIEMETMTENIHSNQLENEFISTIISLRNAENQIEELQNHLKCSTNKINLQHEEIQFLRNQIKKMERKLKTKKNQFQNNNSMVINRLSNDGKVDESFGEIHNEINLLKNQANSIVFDYDIKLKRLNDAIERVRDDLNSSTKVNDWRIIETEG